VLRSGMEVTTNVLTLLSLRLDPGIAIGVLYDLVGNLLDITLDLCIGVLAADETFRREEGVFGVDNSLSLGRDTDQSLAVLGEADDGRCCSRTCE
jgi:hypothetical protein